MGNEDRNAVGDRYGERKPALGRNMTVGVVHTEPAGPISSVRDYTSAMNLRRRGQPSSVGRQLFAELAPSLHDGASSFVGHQTEGASLPGRRKGSNSERGKVVDDL
jgi:hypothetical protein